MYIEKYALYLRRCFDLARLGNGKTSPNPSVGSLILEKENIIGEGWHKQYGKAHAEVNAVADVKPEHIHHLPHSNIFVSLEPCFHFGKTAPCVDLVLKEKISHVVVAFIDPNPKVSGKSILKLRKNNVLVNIPPETPPKIQKGYDNTLKPFVINLNKKRPYVILKWAESADGYMGIVNQRVQISNELSMRLVHKWRSECDAIMVGTRTASIDNPALNNRFYFGKSPVRVVMDRHRILPPTLKIFDGAVKTMLYHQPKEPQKNSDKYDLTHVNFKEIEFDNFLIINTLEDLLKQKIGILLVEGGAKMLQSFIESGLWDEARVIKSDKILRGGISAPRLFMHQLEERFSLDDNEILRYKNL